VLGQAPVAADGSWTLSFVVPTATALGTYALYAFVADAAGHPLDGLLARAQLVVGAAPAYEPPPATAPPEKSLGLPAGRVEWIRAPSASADAPPAAPVAAASRARAARGTARSVVDETPRAVPAPAPRRNPRVRHTLSQLPVQRPAATPRRVRAPVPLVVDTPGHTAPVASPPRLRYLLVLLLALAAGGAGLAVLQRRRFTSRPIDTVEAELQAMIADELARRETPREPAVRL
jgi:hypothetical protein